MLTTFNEVNMTPINLIRNEYKEAFKAKHAGVSLGYMSFFTKAVTRALKLYPDVNSMMDGDYKIAYDFCDISIAVSGPGLMVPVVRKNLTFRGVEADIKRLAIKHVMDRLLLMI
jgi:2-oxoglutarate dehydrogenase E2 component (dihydrolipoamide succinyltransferase)